MYSLLQIQHYREGGKWGSLRQPQTVNRVCVCYDQICNRSTHCCMVFDVVHSRVCAVMEKRLSEYVYLCDYVYKEPEELHRCQRQKKDRLH